MSTSEPPRPSPLAAQPDPYPARTKSTTIINGSIQTTITSISLSDKLLLTISQHGRLAHWIQVPLDVSVPEAHPLPSYSYPSADTDGYDQDEVSEQPNGEENHPRADLLPMSHLTAATILGGRGEEREMFGQLLATQIASAVVLRNGEERRVLVVGLGLEKSRLGREEFLGLAEAAVGVL